MRLPLVESAEIAEHLTKLPGWSLDGTALVKRYEFSTFVRAMQFVNQLASTAETIQHHPDIDIRYTTVRVRLTTHDSGGVTRSDLEMAAATDEYADALTDTPVS